MEDSAGAWRDLAHDASKDWIGQGRSLAAAARPVEVAGAVHCRMPSLARMGYVWK